MERKNLVKAALAAGGQDVSYGPAQLQKLFFLIDRELASKIGGEIFDFQPYDYGPFDPAVYNELTDLESLEKAEINYSGKYRYYSLTPAGYQEGLIILEDLPTVVNRYFKDAANWILSVPFREMVSAIYTKYPDMKANSIFR